LFKKQDVNVWGTNPADMYEAKLVQSDPAKAYKYILPITSKEVELLKEEYEYFTN